MRAIIVDDEEYMLKSFLRTSEEIRDLEVIGQFDCGEDAVEFSKEHEYEIAFLDIAMPEMTGIECAEKLRQQHPDVLIVFISAYDEYIRESNRIGGDYYIVKPYKTETFMMMMEKMRLLQKRQKKEVYIRTFGRFSVLKNGDPVPLTGKAKEILALLVSKCGKEISNEEIYETIWEERCCDNDSRKVYYNAVRRLKDALEKAGIGRLLISTAHGKMVDTSVFDCDYYNWKAKKSDERESFEGEFLSEYSWGESILAEMMIKDE